MQRIDMALSPCSSFPVPYSTGYPTYAALLDILDGVSSEVSAAVHDSPLSTFRNSGLLGGFGSSERDHHQLVRGDRTYRMSIGVTSDEEQSVFRSLVDALMYDQRPIELTDGVLEVKQFESTQATHESLLEEATSYVSPRIRVAFETPTCIEDGTDIQTRVPHRIPVFESLRNKWNKTAPEQYQLDITRDDIRQNVIAQPNPRTYRKHKVMKGRSEDGQLLFIHGFTCDWEAWFHKASDAQQTALTALMLYAEYSGIGNAVARGCGSVSVEVQD
ncbi:CRISPR-associated protein Cas6 [Salinigranum rubrum]|uniref:CRISPR-associated protein Cas6 n=1 Tax=Salinigranum rubrum TaxID=755307 RepID=A0A2I8VLU2_9EURY|nr:CRISPR system precrRNA processing endoribonuclease RAMP protein Cas6 [Salinigranum rubrum]AUV82900.1 CRISPR-associated protein Cas6 [Salinigranum rubrum]